MYPPPVPARQICSLTQPFYMRKDILLVLCGQLVAAAAAFGQADCPGCAVALPDSLPADTFYISPAPDGAAGQYYEADLSFRLPMTTTPVAATDTTILPGLDIDQITILAVVNLPPGLSWQASQTTFYPADGQTDGCARLCGTPLQPGLYQVSVVVVAQVSIVSQSSSFSFPIYIAPATSQTEGFGMTPAGGCGPTTVHFTNNIPSNGQAGFSYFWDFGNGITSTEETPTPQTYLVPGRYPIQYKAVIDTSGFTLSSVVLEQVGCADLAIPPFFNGAPDLFLRLYGPGDALVFESDVIDNAGLPAAFNLGVPLDAGVYRLEVRDDDLFGSEACGEVLFTRDSNGLIINPPLHATIHITHPVQHIYSTDTVIIYPLPQKPELVLQAPGWLCPGDTLALASQYGADVQWYRDTSLLPTATDSVLLLTQAGAYFQQYTSPDGCQVYSDTVWVAAMPAPPLPLFYNDQNLLQLQYPEAFENYQLQWLQDGFPVGQPNDLSLCITEFGTYTLLATDPLTGCQSSFAQTVAYDPQYNCLTALDEQRLSATDFLLWPNPANDVLWLAFGSNAGSPNQSPLRVDIRALDGTLVRTHTWPPETKDMQIEVHDLPAGMWLLGIRDRYGVDVLLKWIKQ